MLVHDFRVRVLVATATLNVLVGLPTAATQAANQAVETPRDAEPNPSSSVEDLRRLSSDLEASVASQKEQLRRTEESLARVKSLLAARQPSGQAIAQFSRAEDERRHAALPAQRGVDEMEWEWSDAQADAEYSARQLKEETKVEAVPVPGEPRARALHLVRDGREVFSWQGHSHTVFVLAGHVLYWADFQPSGNGCELVAYDLGARMQLWRTRLWGIGQRQHSQYRNLINLRLGGEYLTVYGNESGGRYIELVDPKSGRTVGHKTFAP